MRLYSLIFRRKLRKSYSMPYTPELNAISERISRTEIEAAWSLLIQAGFPRGLWPFALKYGIYVINRSQHSPVGDTSLSIVRKKRPSLNHVRVFWCTAYVLLFPILSKLESLVVEGNYLETLENGLYRILANEGIKRLNNCTALLSLDMSLLTNLIFSEHLVSSIS